MLLLLRMFYPAFDTIRLNITISEILRDRDKASLYKMLRMGRGQEEEEEEHSGKEYENNPELKRRARLESEDPIQTISLEDTLRMSLEEAQSNLGMDDFNRTLGSVDESLRSQLTALLSP